MGQLLTANVATNLYWLGRHLERIEATLYYVMLAYDDIIDVEKNAGVKLYKKLEIELQYTNALDFLEQAILGAHNNNLKTISGFARENAIITRNHINNDIFGEIIALHALFQDASKNQVMTDYKLIDLAQSMVSEIWGALLKRKFKKSSDNFIRLGKLVEEADFSFRMDEKESYTHNVINDIYLTLKKLSPHSDLNMIQFQNQVSNYEIVMKDIYKKIASIIVE